VVAAALERRVHLLCGFAACVLLFGFAASAARAQGEPEPGARTTEDVPPAVERLWKEYPLNPTPAGVAGSSTVREGSLAPPPVSAPADDGEGDFLTKPVTLVFVGAAIGLLALIALSALSGAPRPGRALLGSGVLLSRSPSGGSRLAVRRRRSPLTPARPREDGGGKTPRLPKSLRARSDPMSKQPEQAQPGPKSPDQHEGVAHEPVDADYARVGEKVTAVLASAQEAAEQMVASARAESERIRSEAQEQAALTAAAAKSEVERLQRERETLEVEAEDYRKESQAAADGYAAGSRAEAEAEAARRLADADERAQAVVAEAEGRARSAEQESVRRQEARAAAAKRYEDRLTSLLDVFRGMTTQLEELVRTDEEARQADGGGEESDPEATGGEGLEDALRPEARTEVRSS
jgi:hypothetical protein